MYTKKTISFIILSILFIPHSFAYSPSQEDSNLLDNFYKKIDIIQEKSPETLEKTLEILEKYKNDNKNNEKINYLIVNSINYINSKLNNNKIVTREEADEKYKWDLTKIYKNSLEVDEDFKKLDDLLTKLISYKGQLNNNEKLLEFLKLRDEYSIYSDTIWAYKSFYKSIDPTNEEIAILDQKDNNIYSEYEKGTSFFNVEIKEFDDEKIDNLLINEDFSEYKNIFKDLKIEKKHILSQEAENVIAEFGNSHISFNSMYSKLINIDIKYPNITDPEGNEIKTNYSNMYSSWGNKDKDFRQEFTDKFYNTYKQYENILGSIFISDKKEKTTITKLRNYNSVLESKYERYDLPETVYDNLIDTTRDNLDIFHKYLKLKKDYLGLEELHYHDVMSPMSTSSKTYSYEEAKEIIFSSLDKLGEKYVDDLKTMTSNNLIDVYSGENKSGGAYSGYSYTIKPHILINYNNTLGDVSTLAHELGHSVNFYNIMNNQTYNYSNLQFPVEVPSTTNELLLLRELADSAETLEEKIAYLDQYMVTIYTNYWRGTMYGDFERQIYNKFWNGEAVTVQTLNETFETLFKKYYGPDFVYDDFLSIEWAIKPHFFNSYYTHEYAISIAAANKVASNIYNETPGYTDKYLEYIKIGSSNSTNEALKKLDIDLTKTDYLKENLESQKEILQEMEDVINEIKNR